MEKRKAASRLLQSCGGRIRTCDLQVMSLASYQLLHSAMLFSGLFLKSGAKVRLFFEIAKYLSIFFINSHFSQLFPPFFLRNSKEKCNFAHRK